MIRRISGPFVAAVVALVLLSYASAESFRPKDGFVPDEETAIRIAVAIWEPIYGKDEIARQRPYHATPANGVWTVTGSIPKNIPGGVAVAELSQVDARVLRVSHGR
jgi:hypothetical protein